MDYQTAAAVELERRKRAAWKKEIEETKLLPHQRPPKGDWHTWILFGGRGSGKTRGGVDYVIKHLRKYGARARVGVGAPSAANARDVCAIGNSGLISLYRDEFTRFNRSQFEAFHINGGYVKFLGSENPDRWNGPEWSLLWWDELALVNIESYHMSMMGLRVAVDGEPPRMIGTTTPKGRKFIKELLKQNGVVHTKGKMKDNPYLPQARKDYLYQIYGDTKLGRQELDGELFDDVEGAMFNRDWIEAARPRIIDDSLYKKMARNVLALDPSTASAVTNDETGMAVAGFDGKSEYYTFYSNGFHDTPDSWAKRAVSMYYEYDCDCIVAESNQGGEMVRSTIHTVDPNVRVKLVFAHQGQFMRAEPTAVVVEQGRSHHNGVFPTLEDEMCSFTGEPMSYAQRKKTGQHYDRLSAWVYAMLELMGKGSHQVLLSPWSITREVTPWRM